MIADVVDRPGALPLMQYALTELAQGAENGVLSMDVYRRIGGARGALARRAERLFEALNGPARGACRQLFLRLVTLGEGSEDARRRVRRSEVAPIADVKEMDGFIETFGRHRLLSFDRDPATREPTIEIAHEALLSELTRLRGWIDEARDDIRTQRQISSATSEWEASSRDESFLLRGARLEQIASWTENANIGSPPTTMSTSERAWHAVTKSAPRMKRARATRLHSNGDPRAGCVASSPSSRLRPSSPDPSLSLLRTRVRGQAEKRIGRRWPRSQRKPGVSELKP